MSVRNEAVGVGIAVALLSGCSAEQPGYDDYAPGLEQNAPYTAQRHNNLDLHLPEELPVAVHKREKFVGKVSIKVGKNATENVTGVAIEDLSAPDTKSPFVLTAGHVYRYDYESKPTDRDAGCTIDAIIGSQSEPTRRVIAAATIVSKSPAKPDMAMMKTNKAIRTLSADDLTAGVGVNDHLYFTNYQTKPNHMLRTTKDKLAVFGATVLAATDSKIYVVTDPRHPGYEDPKDNTLQGGGSGGPVWTQDGKLAGISNAHIDNTPAKFIEKYYDVTLDGVEPDQELNINIIDVPHGDTLRMLQAAVTTCR